MCSFYGDCWKKGALPFGIFMPEIEWQADKMPEQSFVDLTNSSFPSSDLMLGRTFQIRTSSSVLLPSALHLSYSIHHTFRQVCSKHTYPHIIHSPGLIWARIDFKLSSDWTASQSVSLAHALSCDCAPHVIFSCASFASCVMFSLVCWLVR